MLDGDVIRELVRSESIQYAAILLTQLKIVALPVLLTVSRDTKKKWIKAPEGAYVLSEDMHLQNALEFVVGAMAAENLIVILSPPGTASAGLRLPDDVEPDHVVGTVAGDDTV